ncbi:MAG: hypothetical protein J0G95_10475 [Rhizobiales bacterium]|nr:hypothetical protein [Hyphomicrobiales bacterium]
MLQKLLNRLVPGCFRRGGKGWAGAREPLRERATYPRFHGVSAIFWPAGRQAANMTGKMELICC